MVIVHETDKEKYYDKQRRNDLIKYSNGVTKIHKGSALYLPRRQYNGENIFTDIVNFVSNNKDTIKKIAEVASTVVDTVGKAGTTTLDIVRKAKDITKKIKQE